MVMQDALVPVDTATDAWERLSAMTTNFKDRISEPLAAVLASFAERVLPGVSDALDNVANWFADNSGYIGEALMNIADWGERAFGRVRTALVGEDGNGGIKAGLGDFIQGMGESEEIMGEVSNMMDSRLSESFAELRENLKMGNDGTINWNENLGILAGTVKDVLVNAFKAVILIVTELINKFIELQDNLSKISIENVISRFKNYDIEDKEA
jgi:hypothetical protein